MYKSTGQKKVTAPGDTNSGDATPLVNLLVVWRSD